MDTVTDFQGLWGGWKRAGGLQLDFIFDNNNYTTVGIYVGLNT